jgi:hypothetical protein
VLRSEYLSVKAIRAFGADAMADCLGRFQGGSADDLDHFLAFGADADDPFPFLDFLHHAPPVTQRRLPGSHNGMEL